MFHILMFLHDDVPTNANAICGEYIHQFLHPPGNCSHPTLNMGNHSPGVTVFLDPLGSLTPGGQDTPGYPDPRPGYLDPQVAKYPLSGILPADTLIGVY